MKVKVQFSENLHFKASTRHFKNINIDEPESFHGTDLGPSPIEYFLMGIGGCIGATFAYCLQRKNGSIKKLEIIVDGKMRHIPPDLHLKLIQIDIKIDFSLKGSISKDIIENCKLKFQKYCPITDSIANGIPVNIKFSDSNFIY